MNFAQKIGYALLTALMWPLSRLPLRFHRVLGAWVSHLLYSVVRYRREDVLMNLARAFPEKQIQDLKAIRKKFYRHLGDLVCEAVWFGGCKNPERLRRARIAEVTNPEVLNGFYREGRSVVVLTSHNGNWEIIGGLETYGSYNGEFLFPEKSFSVVYLKQTSAVWNEFLYWNRLAPVHDRKNHDGLQEAGNILRYAVRNRDKQKLYLFITDQRPYFLSSANVEVTFMNQKTLSMTGSVALAKMLSLPVVYQNMKPDGKGHYEITYTPITDDASTMEIKEMTDRYYALLDEDIRKTPWNYLWTHHRWS